MSLSRLEQAYVLDAVRAVEPPPADPQPAVSRQIEVVRGMLSTFDTLTVSGQHYIMDKVVEFLRNHVGRMCNVASPRNQLALIELLERLERETQRLVPDARLVHQRADSLLALLALLP